MPEADEHSTMDYLSLIILAVLIGGLTPLAAVATSAGIIRLLCRRPITTEGSWKICAGIGLLTTGAVNLFITLMASAGWLVIALGWWQSAEAYELGDYAAPLATAINTLWCAALLWRLRPCRQPKTSS